LKTKSKITNDKGYVCIRSNHIELSNKDIDNVFPVYITGDFEDQFNKTLYLSRIKDVMASQDCLIQWEIRKDEWEKIKNIKEPLNINLPKDKLVFIPK